MQRTETRTSHAPNTDLLLERPGHPLSQAVAACVSALAILALSAAFLLAGCAGSEKQSESQAGQETPFSPTYYGSEFSAESAIGDDTARIDISHAQEGFFGASATSTSRCKLQVSCGEQSYHYDLPEDGSPIVVPANMGNGSYKVRIMQNTTGDRYVELLSAETDVNLADENDPFVRPNVICDFDQNSACVKLAGELCAGATTESEAFDAVYDYICTNITYDHAKADALADATGYVPNPDETLESGSGICFDYASLTAAMLRSQGIPTKILTGYVAPDNVYHAWDMIYIDGSWISLHISAPPGQWARADMTFAANGAGDAIGDGSAYADRYTY